MFAIHGGGLSLEKRETPIGRRVPTSRVGLGTTRDGFSYQHFSAQSQSLKVDLNCNLTSVLIFFPFQSAFFSASSHKQA